LPPRIAAIGRIEVVQQQIDRLDPTPKAATEQHDRPVTSPQQAPGAEAAEQVIDIAP
jgi:hypothetical protein